MATISEIDVAAQLFGIKREGLRLRCAALTKALQEVRDAHLAALKEAVAEAKTSHSQLCGLVAASPELFVRPRSLVLHGIKLGFEKGKGQMVIEDEAKTIALIERHLADQAELLVKVEKSVLKKAASKLSAADLKKVGIHIAAAGDVVFAKDTAADVDKLVAAFLKDDTVPTEDQADVDQRAAA